MGRLAGVMFAVILLGACNAEDSDYIPYALEALDAWVYDRDTDRTIFAGRVETNYFRRTEAVARCRDLAIVAARESHLMDWGHVCCTVTSSTDCATKVR